MPIDVKVNDRMINVEILSQQGNLLKVRTDDRIYDIDLMHTADGTFSIIENGRSINIELDTLSQHKKYMAYTLYKTFSVEIIDAESQYLINRGSGNGEMNEKSILSPMPGKVVKVLVAEGDIVMRGQTLIVLSAMKMESEFKSQVDGIVRKVHITDGSVVESNQLLIEID